MPHNISTVKGLVPQIKDGDNSRLTKLQRQFNSKIDKINTLKTQLSEKEAIMKQAEARVQKELRPLLRQTVEVRVKLVRLLDRSYNLTDFRKRERDKIAYLIEQMAYQLIAAHGVEELLELHDKYADVAYAEAARHEEVHETTESSVDVEPEAEEPGDVSGVESQQEQGTDEQEMEKATKKPNQKKTEAQLAKEEKIKAEMNNISKASRRVYMDLVKLLHPDREKDEATRVWKEEAMKEITQAYKQDDFFEMLRLQAKFMKEQEKQLEQLPDVQLKYYLKLLNGQIKDLEAESDRLSFGPDASFYNQYGGTPAQMDQKFGAAKNSLKKQLQQLKLDLKYFGEPAYLKAYLKELSFS